MIIGKNSFVKGFTLFVVLVLAILNIIGVTFSHSWVLIAAGGDLNLDLCRNGDIIAIPYGSDTDISINYMALGSSEASFVITLFK